MLLDLKLILLLCLPVLLPAAETRDGVLARMDTAAASFRGVRAKLVKVTHTAVINDNSEERGSMLLLRTRPREVRVLIQFGEPDVRSIAFSGRKAEIYYPKIKTVHEYDLGKHRSLIDQFLLLAFGTSGKELTRDYSIKLRGQEAVLGREAALLELTPKSAQAREHLARVELWIANPGGHPLQQKFYQPSGDFTLITYTELELNPNQPPDAVELKLPKDVKREYPQR